MTTLIQACAAGVLGVQALAFLILACLLFFDRAPSERATGRLIRFTYGSALLFSLVACAGLLASQQNWGSLGIEELAAPQVTTLSLGDWSLFGDYEFQAVILLDSLSIPFLLLATSLCGVVALFSEKYLHREPGFQRFFLLLCLFGLGDCLTILAGSMEMLFASWELLGLTSALLIGFFHERPGPVNNGLYAFSVYRISDLCLALATVTVYHLCHNGKFTSILGASSWPEGTSALSGPGATAVALLVTLAALGKAAQLPFSGWLPRAMEGPTPSTAIFYGALSVHAGAFLLLRCSPLLNTQPSVSWLIFCLGLSTALWARWVGASQADVKCSLAYASLGQVGLIFAEIGLGLRIFPVIHVVCHSLFRSIQFLKAPSVLHQMHELQSATGRRSLQRPGAEQSWKSKPWFYRLSYQRLYLDHLVENLLLIPFLSFCRYLRKIDIMVLDWVAGEPEESARCP